MPPPIPRQERGRSTSLTHPPALAAFPGNGSHSAPALPISGPHRLFTFVTACTLAGRPEGDLCVEGSGGLVTSAAAPTATGWSDPVAGRASQPAEDFLLFTAHPLQRRVIRWNLMGSLSSSRRG